MQDSGRLAVLDGLRLVAALMVLIYHYTYRAPGSWGRPTTAVFAAVAPVTGYGWLGVELFFVISGFVICMTAWGRGLGGFFVSRAARLFPAYWFAVLTTVVVVALLDPQHPFPGFHDVAVNLTMLQQPLGVASVDGVYWTLWAELHFYLLFALVVRRGVTYRRAVLFCLLWTIASVTVTVSPDPILRAIVDPDSSPFFVAGIAFFLMYRFRPNLLLWGIAGVSCVLGLHRVAPTASTVDSVGGRTLWRPGIVVVVIAIFAVMAAVALRGLSWVRGGWLAAGGALTYPSYLLHQQIGFTLIARLHGRIPPWPLAFALIVVVLGASWLVHRIVERPLAPLIRRGLTDAIAQMRRPA
jgi:peptidoglycan/LPS O-acetylase OafA/YrhL